MITRLRDVVVLVVADDDGTREVVGLLLEESGARVYGANAVQEVLAVLSETIPHVRERRDARIATIAMTGFANGDDPHGEATRGGGSCRGPADGYAPRR